LEDGQRSTVGGIVGMVVGLEGIEVENELGDLGAIYERLVHRPPSLLRRGGRRSIGFADAHRPDHQDGESYGRCRWFLHGTCWGRRRGHRSRGPGTSRMAPRSILTPRRSYQRE